MLPLFLYIDTNKTNQRNIQNWQSHNHWWWSINSILMWSVPRYNSSVLNVMFIRDCYCASMPTTQACKGREASTRVKWGAEQRNRIVEEAPNSTCIGRSLAETGQVETDIYCGRVHVQGCHSPLLILFSFRVGHLVLYGRLPILSARETFLSVCYWYWQDLNKNPSPLFPKRTEWQP